MMVSKITNAVYWTTNTHLPSQILHVLTPEFRWRTTVLTMHKISVDDTDASINYAGGNWVSRVGSTRQWGGGTVHSTTSAGAAATFRFKGPSSIQALIFPAI